MSDHQDLRPAGMSYEHLLLVILVGFMVWGAFYIGSRQSRAQEDLDGYSRDYR